MTQTIFLGCDFHLQLIHDVIFILAIFILLHFFHNNKKNKHWKGSLLIFFGIACERVDLVKCASICTSEKHSSKVSLHTNQTQTFVLYFLLLLQTLTRQRNTCMYIHTHQHWSDINIWVFLCMPFCENKKKIQSYNIARYHHLATNLFVLNSPPSCFLSMKRREATHM